MNLHETKEGKGTQKNPRREDQPSPQQRTSLTVFQDSPSSNAEVSRNTKRSLEPTSEKPMQKQGFCVGSGTDTPSGMSITENGGTNSSLPPTSTPALPGGSKTTPAQPASLSSYNAEPPLPMKVPIKPTKKIGNCVRRRCQPPPRLALNEAKELQAFPTVAPSLETVTGKTVEGADKKVVSAALSIAFSRGKIMNRMGGPPNQPKKQVVPVPVKLTGDPFMRGSRGSPNMRYPPPVLGERAPVRFGTNTLDAPCSDPTSVSTYSAKDSTIEEGGNLKLPQLVHTRALGTETLGSDLSVPNLVSGGLVSSKTIDAHLESVHFNGGHGVDAMLPLAPIPREPSFIREDSMLASQSSHPRTRRTAAGSPQDAFFSGKIADDVVPLQFMDDPWCDYHSHQQRAVAFQDGASVSCDSNKLTPLRKRSHIGYHSSVLHINEGISLMGSDTLDGSHLAANLRSKPGGNRAFSLRSENNFPRFNRLLFTRNTKVFASVERVKETLSELGLPYIPELNHRVLSADFNIYNLAEVHGTYVYVVVAMNVLLSYEFINRFGLDVHKILNFVKEAFTFFASGNPLHHPVHAADIIAAVHQWLSQPTVGANLSDEEMFPFLFTSVVMRVGHCGASNHYLAQGKHPYTTLCCYTAPQQGATMSLTLALLEKPENHFFPSTEEHVQYAVIDTALSNELDEQRPGEGLKAHTWTADKEDMFYDMIAELIMSTDERSYYNIQRSIERIVEDHYVAHGCICPDPEGLNGSTTGPRGTNYHAQNLNKNCKRCCAYISDAHLPTVLSAVLHILNYSYVFRPYNVFLSGNFGFSSAMYRQCDLYAELIQKKHRKQNMQGMKEESIPRTVGSSTVAEPTNFSTPSLPHPQLASHEIVRNYASSCGSLEGQASQPCFVDDPKEFGGVRRGTNTVMRASTPLLNTAVIGAPSIEERVETAIVKAQPRWREDITRTSTVSVLLLRQNATSSTTTAPAPLFPSIATASSSLPTLTGLASFKTSTPTTSVAPAIPNTGITAAPTATTTTGTTAIITSTPAGTTSHVTTPHGRNSHVTSPHGTTPHVTTPHGRNSHVTSPHGTTSHVTTPHTMTSHVTTPHGRNSHGTTARASVTLQEGAERIALPAVSSTDNLADGEIASSVDDFLPNRPLQRQGRDILLHGFEEIHYPMVETMQPYVPAEWVQKSHHNFTRFLTELPTEEEYDTIVERVLLLCGASKLGEGEEGKTALVQRLIQAVEEIEVAKHVPFDLIEVAVQPRPRPEGKDYAPSTDTEIEVRMLKEILRSSEEFIRTNGGTI